ncbi:MAG: enoyl-CoA hydratase/isomerase family protein [Pseudomonadales bacterium]
MPIILTKQLTDDVLLITLNRPDSLNSLNPELLLALIDTFKGLNRDRSNRVAILTGAGRGFCAGADLAQDANRNVPGTEGMQQLGYVYKYQELIADVVLAINECDKPVIAAINGAAVGGGFGIALACDLRIAVATAKFGSVFIKTGLSSCDIGTSYFLPRLIHPAKAMELMITGRIFSGEEALQFGLLNQLTEPDQLLDAAKSLAEDIVENAEYGVWMTKKGFWTNLNAPSLRHAMELENRTQVLGYFTGCMEEAMDAFEKGRPPQWKPL